MPKFYLVDSQGKILKTFHQKRGGAMAGIQTGGKRKKRAPSRYNMFVKKMMLQGYSMADAAKMWNQSK